MTIFVGKSARDMMDYLCLNHANDYAQSVGAETLHPMVNVVHFDELGPIAHTLNKIGDDTAWGATTRRRVRWWPSRLGRL